MTTHFVMELLFEPSDNVPYSLLFQPNQRFMISVSDGLHTKSSLIGDWVENTNCKEHCRYKKEFDYKVFVK